MGIVTTKMVMSYDGSMVFKQRCRGRLLGAALLVGTILPAMLIAKVFTDPTASQHGRYVLLKILGTAGGMLLLLGLYLVSRWKSISIGQQGIVVEGGWLLWGRRRVYNVTDFAGLQPYNEVARKQSGKTGALTVLGLVLMIVFGVGVVAWRNVPVYCLRLVKRGGSHKKIPFYSTMDVEQMKQILKTLVQDWAIKLVP